MTVRSLFDRRSLLASAGAALSFVWTGQAPAQSADVSSVDAAQNAVATGHFEPLEIRRTTTSFLLVVTGKARRCSWSMPFGASAAARSDQPHKVVVRGCNTGHDGLINLESYAAQP